MEILSFKKDYFTQMEREIIIIINYGQIFGKPFLRHANASGRNENKIKQWQLQTYFSVVVVVSWGRWSQLVFQTYSSFSQGKNKKAGCC